MLLSCPGYLRDWELLQYILGKDNGRWIEAVGTVSKWTLSVVIWGDVISPEGCIALASSRVISVVLEWECTMKVSSDLARPWWWLGLPTSWLLKWPESTVLWRMIAGLRMQSDWAWTHVVCTKSSCMQKCVQFFPNRLEVFQLHFGRKLSHWWSIHPITTSGFCND